jgi:hypothetical protein
MIHLKRAQWNLSKEKEPHNGTRGTYSRGVLSINRVLPILTAKEVTAGRSSKFNSSSVSASAMLT